MATKTLRPNAAGDEANLDQFPASGSNYDKIEEETADDDTTYVYRESAVEARDLYNLPAVVGAGTINHVKVYFKCRKEPTGTAAYARAVLKSNSTVTEGDLQPLIDNWGAASLESQTFTTNPADSEAWEWSDFADLQVGVWLRGTGTKEARCTQLYIEIDFDATVSPSDPLLRVSGIKRSFWAGTGGQSVYQTELALGGMSITYVSPIGGRDPASAITPTPLPSGPGYSRADYEVWLNFYMTNDIQYMLNIFGKIPTYEEWLKWKQAPNFPKYF